tara:strand:+ start:1365 stop:1628 length:264 start_codon:yes stop_codon:yes gene_type:complete
MKGFNIYHVLNDYSLELATDDINEDDYDIDYRALHLDGHDIFSTEYLIHELTRELHYIITEDTAPDLSGRMLSVLLEIHVENGEYEL